MTLDRATEWVPYLKRLGISHLYASPIFTATSGSTHGYDVTDFNEIDPAIGGMDGFQRLCAALKDAGLGMILDIVPNHMAASVENAWWADMLKHGQKSRYASYFDIDWNERVTLPILGKPFDNALADGDLRLQRDPQSGELVISYLETTLPLEPQSTGGIVGIPSDTASISRLHDLQHWRLTHWKEAAKHLSYRRFFEVTGLVGLRVEDEAVFADCHRLVLDLVRSGDVDGLRIDHIDGLADPAAYLDRLRAETGPETFIVVEKILGRGESLPENWPVEGTTGYEFIAALSAIYIDGDGLRDLGAAYGAISPETADFAAGLRAAKKRMVERNFEGEVSRLVRLAGITRPEVEGSKLAAAIQELLIAFPVYRTYGRAREMQATDSRLLSEIASKAGDKLSDREALDAVARLVGNASPSEEFQRRFQQLSGPIMAKAMEDTLFYRHNRLLAANEVGGEPGEPPGGINAFHQLMQERAELQPHGLSATSTHDTKRGEDARARLYALSEDPGMWSSGVARWRQMNRDQVVELHAGVAPAPDVEWMLYQALAGVWPDDLCQGLDQGLSNRFVDYAEKAVREAKLRTSWDEPDPDYEDAVRAYAAAISSFARLAFETDFSKVLKPLVAAGYVNSLSQTAIKLTAPGIPDIYQGAEALDFSLVDPDNRRPVDLTVLSAMLVDGGSASQLTAAALKQRVVEIGLHLRNRRPALFANGRYLPLMATGSRKQHAVAFARVLNGDYTITVAPRLMLRRVDPGTRFAGPEFWADTHIVLPELLQGRKCELLTGRILDPGGILPLAELLGGQPVALIESCA